VLLYINQSQLISVNPNQEAETVNIMPVLGGTNGALATFRF
jgi:hypothetical protein